ncbi:hypothetical protein DFH11DRAFT_1731028 [Phellopilus nigrolimitatus]|nr:hypothetical protein DFH11DRAFT_1731028 [Phellopilus nigrolimitatus]
MDYYTNDSSDDDDGDDAPEAVSLSQSMAEINKIDRALQTAKSEARKKGKEKNRIKDEKLKQRAEETRGNHKKGGEFESTRKGKVLASRDEDGGSGQKSTLEDRMERAMRDAEDEEAEGSDDAWGGSRSGVIPDDDRDEHGDIAIRESFATRGFFPEGEFAEDTRDHMEDAEEKANGRGSTDTGKSQENGLDYLPEHLFTSAFSKSWIPKDGIPPTTKQIRKSKSDQKRKKQRARPSKDFVLG